MRRIVAADQGGVAWSIGPFARYAVECVAWLARRIASLPALAACVRGGCPRVEIRLRPVVARTADGRPAAPLEHAAAQIAAARALLSPHAIDVVGEPPVLGAAADLPPLTCGPRALLQPAFAHLGREAAASAAITVFFLETIPGARGCSFPATSWIAVDPSADGSVLVHELGHLAGLFRHSPDPDNVMTNDRGGTASRLTHVQACVVRTAPFARRA